MYMNLIWAIIALIIGIALIVMKLQHPDYDKITSSAGLVLVLAAVVLFFSSIIRVVPAGTVGVVDIFGKVSETERQAGMNFVNPFARLVIMNVKTEEIKETLAVPSKEGMSVSLEASILYRLSSEKASDIYSRVGTDYRNIVIVPLFRSVCRGVTVNYEAKALYTSGREEIADKIAGDLQDMFNERGVVLERALLRAIILPPTVAGAIEMKLKAEQEAEQMKFVLDKERKEAERRVIEAEGIAKAQDIINKTLTPAYLQHEAIQAQMKLAGSPNHTTVYIPVGTYGIPLIKTIDSN